MTTAEETVKEAWGIACPKCGCDTDVHIVAAVTVKLVHDGTVEEPGHEWTDESRARCNGCHHSGTVATFRLDCVPEACRKLPPDPEGMNDRRAAWAGAALLAFHAATGAEHPDWLGDLMCDLMHWCDRNNCIFEWALDRARWHYEAETIGEAS